jgi:hypothetical protein
MAQIVFKRGCGKGNNPPRNLHDKIERRLIRLAVLQPADDSVAEKQEAVLVDLEHALAAADRQAPAVTDGVTPAVTVTRNVTAAVTRNVTFTDALEPGYRPRPPRSERERLEERLRAVRARLWSDPGDRVEIEAELSELQAQLRSLEGKA